ncbi:TolC family protein [bacterium]|nr:TolC family protein [bacterium]
MFWKKNVPLIILIFYSLFSLLFAESILKEKTIVLQDLVNEAIGNNPEIQAAYYNWQAAMEKIKQVSSLPDPKAKYTYFGEKVETKVGPQEAKYGLSQKIPFPGKLSLKAKVQSKHVDMFREKYEATKREVIKNIKLVYYDIFWVDKAIQITEEEKTILESLERVAQRKYESDIVPQQDVIKAQVELSKLINKLFLLKQNRKSLEAKMNSILNRPKGTELRRIDTVKPIEFKYKLDELHQIAKSSKQELLIANLDVERAEHEKSLVRLDRFPDFTFGFDYIQVGNGHTSVSNDGQDAWMGTVSVNIPIWFGKLRYQLKEKEVKLAASKKNYQNIENSVTYEIEDVYFKITTYKDIILLYKTALMPQTEQSFEAARTGYETGRVDFLNWLDAERALLQTRLAYYKVIVDYQKSIAFLERVVGKNL